jgi:hypothetical protein
MYTLSKGTLPMDVDFMLSDTFEQLRSKLVLYKTFEDAAQAVEEMMAAVAKNGTSAFRTRCAALLMPCGGHQVRPMTRWRKRRAQRTVGGLEFKMELRKEDLRLLKRATCVASLDAVYRAVTDPLASRRPTRSDLTTTLSERTTKRRKRRNFARRIPTPLRKRRRTSLRASWPR